MLRKLNKKQLAEAIETLQSGGIVAIPTETVYGLAGDANNPEAIAKIFNAKGRPRSQALSVLVASVEELAHWATDIPDYAKQLAAAFWPGPLTLILKKQPHVLDELTASNPSIGLRVPDNAMAQQVLTAFGGGLAAPSANTHQNLSPTLAEHVREDLGDKVDLILDGGICARGIESTIIDCTGEAPVIVREGYIQAPTIEEMTGLCIPKKSKANPKNLGTPIKLCSSQEVDQAITQHTSPKNLIIISKRKPNQHHVSLHDARIPSSKFKPTPDTEASIHWILMPEDVESYQHSFYEQLHIAKQLGHAGGQIIIEKDEHNESLCGAIVNWCG